MIGVERWPICSCNPSPEQPEEVLLVDGVLQYPHLICFSCHPVYVLLGFFIFVSNRSLHSLPLKNNNKKRKMAFPSQLFFNSYLPISCLNRFGDNQVLLYMRELAACSAFAEHFRGVCGDWAALGQLWLCGPGSVCISLTLWDSWFTESICQCLTLKTHLSHPFHFMQFITYSNLERDRASTTRSASVFISAGFNMLCFIKQFRDDKVLLLQINHRKALKASDSY